MNGDTAIRERLHAAIAGPERGRAAAERLCAACVETLEVDGAALSVSYDGALSRSYAATSPLGRELDELQFTVGEGPCIDAITNGAPVLTPDLDGLPTTRWSGFTEQALRRGVRAVFALPVFVAAAPVGALDLYRNSPGELRDGTLAGAFLAAELAALPLLDLLGIDLDAAVEDEASSDWAELTSLTRVEVYQAAGMVIVQLGVGPTEALVRIRGYAYAHGMTASQVAYEILERRLRIGDDPGGADAKEERT